VGGTGHGQHALLKSAPSFTIGAEGHFPPENGLPDTSLCGISCRHGAFAVQAGSQAVPLPKQILRGAPGPSWSCPARPAGFPAVGFHRLLALGPTIRTGRFRTVSGTLLSFRLKFGDTGYRRLKHHLQLAEFLEPGANLAGYLVAPGSRNHGSELPRDWRDLNAYVLGSAGIGRNEMLSNQNEWRNGDYVSWGLAQVGCDVPLFPIPFPESPPRSNILRVSAVFLA
jgi:hypothetical protein